ncbi:MAG TPA: zinc-ribbon domain containing protein [Chloroflexota bacterium]|nr:zinc-ribbon domain containing protein [Chloroflexota bacterium]
MVDQANSVESTYKVDKSLVCRDCGITFTFTVGEQEFYQQRGLLHDPQRCPACRASRRRERTGQPPREMHAVVCAECGAQTMVPFLPRLDRPVYCSTCFERTREVSEN